MREFANPDFRVALLVSVVIAIAYFKLNNAAPQRQARTAIIRLLQTNLLNRLRRTGVNQAISVAVQRVVAFNILEYRYTSLPKGRVAAHAHAEPGGADWDDDEPEAQQEPGEGAATGGGGRG